MLTALATRYLERHGHVVLNPGTGHQLVGGYVVFPAELELKVVPSSARVLRQGERAVSAAARVIPEGYVAERLEPVPAIDSIHTPTIGTAEPRTVVSVFEQDVTYRTEHGTRTCRVASFNEWRREKRAMESRG